MGVEAKVGHEEESSIVWNRQKEVSSIADFNEAAVLAKEIEEDRVTWTGTGMQTAAPMFNGLGLGMEQTKCATRARCVFQGHAAWLDQQFQVYFKGAMSSGECSAGIDSAMVRNPVAFAAEDTQRIRKLDRSCMFKLGQCI